MPSLSRPTYLSFLRSLVIAVLTLALLACESLSPLPELKKEAYIDQLGLEIIVVQRADPDSLGYTVYVDVFDEHRMKKLDRLPPTRFMFDDDTVFVSGVNTLSQLQSGLRIKGVPRDVKMSMVGLEERTVTLIQLDQVPASLTGPSSIVHEDGLTVQYAPSYADGESAEFDLFARTPNSNVWTLLTSKSAWKTGESDFYFESGIFSEWRSGSEVRVDLLRTQPILLSHNLVAGCTAFLVRARLSHYTRIQ